MLFRIIPSTHLCQWTTEGRISSRRTKKFSRNFRDKFFQSISAHLHHVNSFIKNLHFCFSVSYRRGDGIHYQVNNMILGNLQQRSGRAHNGNSNEQNDSPSSRRSFVSIIMGLLKKFVFRFSNAVFLPLNNSS